MSPLESITVSRAELEMLASDAFQASADAGLAERLLGEVGQSGRADFYSLSLVNIKESLVEALTTFAASQDPTAADGILAASLADRITKLP